MGTTLIQPKNRGSSLKGLTDQQLVFVHELLAEDRFDATKAARKAGYSNPSQAANKLLKNDKIAAALGKAQRLRLERLELEADEVLSMLATVLFFNPLEYFTPGPDGWTILDPKDIPPQIGRLIEDIEVKHTENPSTGETSSYFSVKFISKTTALGYAMKHCGVEKHEVKHFMSWDALFLSPEEVSEGEDEIEAAIREVENLSE